jgi:hypothetical protein
MTNLDIVLTLVFAAGVMIIMIFPAMKITDWIGARYHMSQDLDDKLTVILTIMLSLIVGVMLKFL